MHTPGRRPAVQWLVVAATGIDGTRGINGVVLVTTRHGDY